MYGRFLSYFVILKNMVHYDCSFEQALGSGERLIRPVN
ncbi:MAG: hypothetical protein BSOLF_1531 [Candidatus Carbobacillus altaicus]|uniref:Uncharacterized protein n=1 Tax=Candidatus Carbonibacillus altaicus TaxID=2163959 RepID=A0A2R6XZ74_9BACL|nr:MAG: hypothetical protein BSOLF_1531 [Candidatus Carbobacillus altaicus]